MLVVVVVVVLVSGGVGISALLLVSATWIVEGVVRREDVAGKTSTKAGSLGRLGSFESVSLAVSLVSDQVCSSAFFAVVSRFVGLRPGVAFISVSISASDAASELV